MNHLSLVSLLLASAALAQDPAADDFERHLLGSSWIVLGATTAGIVNNSDLGAVSGTGCAVSWAATTFAADQFSEATICSDKDPDMLTQVFVRMRAADRARYGFHWNGDPGKSQWEVKYDGVPTAQTRILAFVPGPGPVPGDTLRIEAEGSTTVMIRGYHNGRLKLLAFDTALERIQDGVCGVVARMKQGTTITPPTPIFERWSGGSLCFFDLGNALPGVSGIPALRGTGATRGGAPLTLSVQDALPIGVAVLVLGGTRVDQPLFGGMLVPSLDLALALPLDAQGRASLPATWPLAVPPGLRAYCQAWLADPVGPQGFAATNALSLLAR